MDDPRVEELRVRELNRNIPLIVVVAIILVLGIVGNIFCIVFYGFSKRRTVTNFLIAALATNDLLANIIYWDEMAVVFQSFTFTDKAGCKTIFLLNTWVLVNSVILLAVISIDRYRRVCHPFSRQISPRVAWIVVLGVSIVTFILTLREVFLAEIVTKEVKMNDNSTVNGYFCVHTDDPNYATVIQVSHFINVLLILCSMILMIVLYSLIIRKIIRTRKVMAHNVVFTRDRGSTSVLTTNSTEMSDADKKKTPQTENGTLEAPDESYETTKTKNKTNAPCVAVSGPDTVVTKTQEPNSDIPSETGSSRTTQGKAQVQKPNDIAETNKDHEASTKTFKAEKSVTKMVIAFTAVSILSFFPYFGTMIFGSRHVSTEDNLSNMGRKIARQFYMLNCVVNPYIMCYFNSRFRRFIRSFICRRTCMLSE